MEHALKRLSIPPELALEFLAVFSRVEYALKVVPRFRQAGKGELRANWQAFLNEISPDFHPEQDAAVRPANDRLIGAKLRYFAVVQGEAKWDEYPMPGGLSDAARVVRVARQVRNNLFHGGKYAPDPDSNPNRERELVESSMRILLYLVDLSPDLRAAFYTD